MQGIIHAVTLLRTWGPGSSQKGQGLPGSTRTLRNCGVFVLFWDPSSACEEIACMGMVKVTCLRGCAQPCSGGCVPPSCWQFPGSLPMCSIRDKITLGDGAGYLSGDCLALGPTSQAVCRFLPWDASVPFSLAIFDRRQGWSLLDLFNVKWLHC